MTCGVSYDEPADTPIADEDVGAEPEHEVGHAERAGRGDRICERIGRCGIVQEVRRPTDLERRERR